MRKSFKNHIIFCLVEYYCSLPKARISTEGYTRVHLEYWYKKYKHISFVKDILSFYNQVTKENPMQMAGWDYDSISFVVKRNDKGVKICKIIPPALKHGKAYEVGVITKGILQAYKKYAIKEMLPPKNAQDIQNANYYSNQAMALMRRLKGEGFEFRTIIINYPK